MSISEEKIKKLGILNIKEKEYLLLLEKTLPILL
jgi:hypothetical protein